MAKPSSSRLSGEFPARPLPEWRTGPFPPPLAAACPPAPAPAPARLTALEDGAVVGQAAAALERRAVPALVAQLVLTLVDRDVQALERGRGHVGAAQAQAQLPLAQARQREAHGVGGQRRLAGQLQAQDLVAEGPGNPEGGAGSAARPRAPPRSPPAGRCVPPAWAGGAGPGLLTDCRAPGPGDPRGPRAEAAAGAAPACRSPGPRAPVRRPIRACGTGGLRGGSGPGGLAGTPLP